VLFLLLLLIIIVLSIPAVQTKIAKYATEKLNETYDVNIQIDRMGLNWKGEVDIRNVMIRDHHNDSLIYSEFLNTNILSIPKLIDGNLDFGFIELQNTKLFVKTYKGETEDNLDIFTSSFSSGDTTATEPFYMWARHIDIKQGHIRIIDENLESPVALDLTELNLDASEFYVEDVIVKSKIKDLSFKEHRGLVVDHLEGDFTYGETEMVINNTVLKTPHSSVDADIKMTYNEGMADFVNKVWLDINFKESALSTNDLNTFYNEFGADITIYLKGFFHGYLNDFKMDEAELTFKNTSLQGNFQFTNLFNDDIMDIKSDGYSINTNYYDLKELMPSVIGESLPVEIKKMGFISFSGNTRIEGDVLFVKGKINSALGGANADLSIGNIEDFTNAYYKGNVALQNFNLGKLAGTTSLGAITANLNFDGRGFSPKTVSTQVDGNISSFTFEGYTYKNIVVAGNFKNPIFNGHLEITDPNLIMTFDGLIDVSQQLNHYNFEADIEFAELNKLNLFKRDSISVFAGKIKMNMDGTSIDDVVGTIQFTETFYQTATNDFFFEDFAVTSTYEGEERIIEINSPDIINGRIRGKFIVEDIPYLFRNSIGSIYANYIPVQVTTDQYLKYDFTIYNKIIDVFIPEIQVGDNTRIKGAVYSDESQFELDFKSPEMLIYENYLGDINVEIDNDNPLYNAYISVDSLYTGVYDLREVQIINKTLKDTLFVQSKFRGGGARNDQFGLSLYHTINPEGNSVLGIKRSKINYQGYDWFLNRNNNNLNKITFDDNFTDIKLDSLTLSHENELIQLAGFKNDSTSMDIKMQFSNVDIGKLMPTVDSLKLKGYMNGDLRILKKQDEYLPTTELVIADISMNNIDMGDLNLSVRGNSDLTYYDINSSLVNDNVKSFTMVGGLNTAGENSTIDLDIDFREFNLAAFSPFGGDVFSNLRGMINGNARATGNYTNPILQGDLYLSDAGLTITYLNTDFDLDPQSHITIEKDRLLFNTMTITDTKEQTEGSLSGAINHKKYGDWNMNLHLETDRLLVLDTPPDDDALYYGTAFISGYSDIHGPVDELIIDVVATTEEGTTFKIPISDAVSIGDDSFIRFISPEEKKARLAGEEYVAEELKGLSLNFDLDINDKAEVEILVDKVNNSTFKGRGAGLMFMEINTLGKFRMWGEFVVIEGDYDFRYGGFVDKNIDVVPGGRITWNGEPTQALLNLTAKYTVKNVNPSALLDNPSLNTTVDVEVLLNLTGEIMQPDLDFQINFPNVSSSVREELNVKLSDKDQRQLQGIYLAATGTFQGERGNLAAGTLTEKLNKVVADIFSESNAAFKVLPTISTRQVSLDEQLEYLFGVRTQLKISERILVDGSVAVPVNNANETVIAGDVEVQWLVNDDGSFRINFFNRQADLQFIGEDQIYEQGGGVSYVVDFDTFKELMLKIFNKKLTKEPILVVPDSDVAPDEYMFNSPALKEEEND